MKSSSGIQRWSFDEAKVESPVTKSPETEAVLLNAHKCALNFDALLKVCSYFSSAFGVILTNFYLKCVFGLNIFLFQSMQNWRLLFGLHVLVGRHAWIILCNTEWHAVTDIWASGQTQLYWWAETKVQPSKSATVYYDSGSCVWYEVRWWTTKVWGQASRSGLVLCVPFSALTLMVEWQKGHPAHKNSFH